MDFSKRHYEELSFLGKKYRVVQTTLAESKKVARDPSTLVMGKPNPFLTQVSMIAGATYVEAADGKWNLIGLSSMDEMDNDQFELLVQAYDKANVSKNEQIIKEKRRLACEVLIQLLPHDAPSAVTSYLTELFEDAPLAGDTPLAAENT